MHSMRSSRSWLPGRAWGAMLLLLLCAALAGCAYPTQFKPGTPQQEVLSQLGPANTVKQLDGGGERWLYTTQPMGREAYQLRFAADGQLQSTTQVLTAQNFGAIPLGQFSQQQLMQDFGPPMEITSVWSFKGQVWTYRFWDNGIKRFAHVHVDPQGVVQKLMFMDEPLPEPRQRD